jgi:hypothetical protein
VVVEEVGGKTVVVVERGFWLMSSSVLPGKFYVGFISVNMLFFFPKRIVL